MSRDHNNLDRRLPLFFLLYRGKGKEENASDPTINCVHACHKKTCSQQPDLTKFVISVLLFFPFEDREDLKVFRPNTLSVKLPFCSLVQQVCWFFTLLSKNSISQCRCRLCEQHHIFRESFRVPVLPFSFFCVLLYASQLNFSTSVPNREVKSYVHVEQDYGSFAITVYIMHLSKTFL